MRLLEVQFFNLCIVGFVKGEGARAQFVVLAQVKFIGDTHHIFGSFEASTS